MSCRCVLFRESQNRRACNYCSLCFGDDAVSMSAMEKLVACLMHSALLAMSAWRTSVAEKQASAQAMHTLDELTAADDTVVTGRGCIQVPPRYEVLLIGCGTVGLRATWQQARGSHRATYGLDLLSCTRPPSTDRIGTVGREDRAVTYPCIGRGSDSLR